MAEKSFGSVSMNNQFCWLSYAGMPGKKIESWTFKETFSMIESRLRRHHLSTPVAPDANVVEQVNI